MHTHRMLAKALAPGLHRDAGAERTDWEVRERKTCECKTPSPIHISHSAVTITRFSVCSYLRIRGVSLRIRGRGVACSFIVFMRACIIAIEISVGASQRTWAHAACVHIHRYIYTRTHAYTNRFFLPASLRRKTTAVLLPTQIATAAPWWKGIIPLRDQRHGHGQIRGLWPRGWS